VFNPAYIGLVMMGLLHGVEPGHGWPVAMLYSVKKRNTVFSAIVSSGIIGMGHLVSSIAVVVAYVLLQAWLDFEAPWIKYLAAALLLILAFKLFREKVDGLERQHGHIMKINRRLSMNMSMSIQGKVDTPIGISIPQGLP